MKRISILIAAIFALSICATARDAEMVNKTFDFDDFNVIYAGFTHHITVTQGSSNKIEVSCPKKYIDHLDYSASRGVLNLNIDLSTNEQNDKTDKIYVKLQMEEISMISLSGAAEMALLGQFKGGNVFYVNLSGAAELDGESYITAEHIRCVLSGASECSIAGKCNVATAILSGASELDMNIDANSVIIDASGASECNYNGKKMLSVNAQCSGSSEIELTGITEHLRIDCSGASEVDAKNLVAQTAIATANGASKINVTANEKLNLTTTGASKIKYFGKAKEIQTSGKSISKGW